MVNPPQEVKPGAAAKPPRKGERKMYRVQLFVNENSRRGRVLLGSWTCPTKEIAEKKFSSLKSKYRNADYEVVVFEI